MKKAMLILAFLVFVTFLTVETTAQTVQGQTCDTMTIWKNKNHTCPPGAVCADVINAIRKWSNGSTCPEKRRFSSCLCSSGVCPFENPDHELFTGSSHRIYTCEPKCNFSFCQHLQSSSPSSYGPEGPIAMTKERFSPEFHTFIFDRIHCRCPLHHNPSSGTAFEHDAVLSWNTTYDYETTYSQESFVCRYMAPYVGNEDPC